MAVTFRDYSADQVDAARSVILELVNLLGEYREQIVVVGGWVPSLIFPTARVAHIGSKDVDLALDHRKLRDVGYATIQALLLKRGYTENQKQPFIFHRAVLMNGNSINVEVDFLAGEYKGTGKSHRTQVIHDGRARKARGCDLAFDLNVEMEIEGQLPEGGYDSARIRVSSAVAFLVMKGMALHDRLKEKDAWDIYFTLTNYPGGLAPLAEDIKLHLNNKLVLEGLGKIGEKFMSPEHIGPRFVADFDEIRDPDDRSMRMRDAFERVNHLLIALGVRG